MNSVINKHPVQHPILKKYIKFFWEIHADSMQLNHKIIPVRNIDLKFNLSETPHYLKLDSEKHLLEEVYFSGLQDHFRNAHILLDGKVHVLGVCFLPEGFYPFIKIPVSEIKNQLLGTREVGFYRANTICKRLIEAPDTSARLTILESELLSVLENKLQVPENFRELFNTLKQNDNFIQIVDLCQQNNISIRKLERMYNKYVGISAKTYCTLNRFQNTINQLFYNNYAKLSDIAYDNDYFDQMHFIRDFKRFSGITPKKFLNQNDSMLHVGKPR